MRFRLGYRIRFRPFERMGRMTIREGNVAAETVGFSRMSDEKADGLSDSCVTR